MIYSGIINYNGYIYTCDKPEDFAKIELIANVVVPQLIKAEPFIQTAMEDVILYGVGYLKVCRKKEGLTFQTLDPIGMSQ
mgnify:CR=1 FL=1